MNLSRHGKGHAGHSANAHGLPVNGGICVQQDRDPKTAIPSPVNRLINSVPQPIEGPVPAPTSARRKSGLEHGGGERNKKSD